MSLSSTARHLRRTLGAALLGLVLAGSCLAQQKEAFKLGVATDLSGTWAPIGEQVMRAIKFAVEEANKAGGVDGRQVVYRSLDSEGKPEVARRQNEKLVAEGYRVLTGIVSSGETLAIEPLLDRWDALYMATIGKADAITGTECKPRMFRANINNSMDQTTIKLWLAGRKERKWDIIASDITFARGSAELFGKIVRELNGTVVNEFYAASNTNDFAPFIEKIKSSGSEGVWVVVGGRDAMTFAQQANQFGLIKAKTMGGVSFIADQEARQLGEIVKGIFGIVNYSATLDTPENKRFVEHWAAAYNNALPTNFEGETYMGVRILFDAVKATGSTEPKTLAAYMQGKSFETIKGRATMRAEDNQLISPNYFGAIDLNRGVYRPVISATIAAAQLAPPITCKR